MARIAVIFETGWFGDSQPWSHALESLGDRNPDTTTFHFIKLPFEGMY
jgi:hypothetical protein